MDNMDKNQYTARMIAKDVALKGGRVYYVGGCVRDMIMGKENKDIDIEVYGVTPDELKAILARFGELKMQGAAFGVYNIKGLDLDIAQPRMETATGRGHKDFEVYVDPFIPKETAARRRDFTMNALMQDVLTEEIIDFFGGQDDIRNGLIRHIDDDTFAEDPLRVCRAAQFSARFGFEIAPDTKAVMRRMRLDSLSKERVYGEMRKALLKAPKPSVFFEALRETAQLDTWFPELEAMIGCRQDTIYHPEGDVWTHTMRVIDAAAKMKEEAQNAEFFMIAALCHDIGKPAVTAESPDGRIHAHGHDSAGVPLARGFLDRLNPDTHLREYVLEMVEHHSRPHHCFNAESRTKTTNHMFDAVHHPEDLCLLAVADTRGKGNGEEEAEKEKAFLTERLSVYTTRAREPIVSGKDLIDMGLSPSPAFKEILKSARKMHFSGVDKAAVLKDIAAKHRKEIDQDRADALIASAENKKA